jgi:hypothetical protein
VLTPSQITVTKNQTFDFVAEPPSIREYPYTGTVQQDTLPAGTYKIECWGAQGGNHQDTSSDSWVSGSGLGGYSVGELTLTDTTPIFVYVGGKGGWSNSSSKKAAGGFNGGGTMWPSGEVANGGGGASDVRIGTDSLYARVIVAGGGGGSGEDNEVGGYGGGTTGGKGSGSSATGGTQSSAGTGGAFGKGANRAAEGGGGGGGWYGGGTTSGTQTIPTSGSGTDSQAGCGGSGYVYTSGTAGNYPSGCLLNSSHYLSDAQTIAGDASMPSVSGSTETGHSGDGYIRITRLS